MLLLLLALLVGWVAGTRSGLDFAWSLLAPRLPDSIAVGTVEGRLLGPLTVTDVAIDNDSMQIAVERIHLQWQPAELLHATVHVEQLAISGVRYLGRGEKAEPPQDKEPFTLPDAIQLPMQLRLDQLTLDDVAIRPSPAAEAIELSQARLQDVRLQDERWQIGALSATGPRFDLHSQAAVEPHDRYASSLQLQADLQLPDLAAIDSELQISGDLDRLMLDARVAAPYNIELEAALSDINPDALAELGINATLRLDKTRISALRDDLPELAPLSLQLQVSGNLQQLTLHSSMAAPYNLELVATLSDLPLAAEDRLAELGIDATLQLSELQPSAIGDALPELAPLSTQLRVTGTPRELKLKQTAAAPYNLQLTATLQQLLATPQIEAKLALTDSRLAAIMPDLPQVVLDSELHLSGTAQQLALNLELAANSEKFGPARANAAIQYTPEVVTIEQLQLRRPDSPLQVDAAGTLALAAGNAMDVALSWKHLGWPLDGEAVYSSRQGQLELSGTLEDYDLAGALDWQVSGQAEGHLELAGSGDRDSFVLSQLAISGGPGTINATADVAWAPALAISAHVEGQHINPGAIVADMPGDFSLLADIRARQDDDGLTAHVDQLSAQGKLRGQPLQLEAELAYLADRIDITQLQLAYGAAKADVSGQLGLTPAAPLALDWSLAADDLATLWPGLTGTLQTQGSTSGTLGTPSVDATLDARSIEYEDNSVAAIDLDATLDWSGRTQSRLDLVVSDAQAAGQRIHALTINGSGTPAQHQLKLEFDGSDAELALALDGMLAQRPMVWDFTLTSLRAVYGELAAWQLAAPASGQVTADAQHIAAACLTSQDARLCIDAAHDQQGASAKLQLDDLAFAYLDTFLPEDLDLSGSLSAAVDATLPAQGTPAIALRLQTTPGEITVIRADAEQPVEVLAFDPAHVNLELDSDGLDARVDVPLGDTGAVRARLQVPDGTAPLSERPLDGTVDINITELDFVPRLAVEVSEIDGRMDGTLRISGSLQQPRVLGEITLQAEQLGLMTPGLELADVRIDAVGRGETINIDMGARSGGGELHVTGAVDLGQGGPRINLAIQGEQFQIANTTEALAWISPDLELTITPQQVHASGRLEVPKARITPRDLPAAGVVTEAEDTVIEGADQPAGQAVTRAVHAEIEVILGDVQFAGFGLETGIEGNLKVIQLPGEPATGTGELNLVNGAYRAYGQNLDIQRGEILFSGGPITSPALELRAARYPADDVTVGVNVRGSVKQPELTLFSNPAMPQAEILSWLLLGRPLEGASGGESNLIAKAALALGSGRANKVLGGLGDALGLDDIGVGSAAGHGSEEAAFMLGKYLTPQLYVSYGIGIFSSVATLSLRYTLNSHWHLESETSSVGTGGDIIYSFDR
ncbi:MAG TPA: translocation/assembly module TamB domain-containing protein [Salinisphaeraceae bacterium]|nr:translocation/assembly module TamB domain-containing protein [Salinisphaeraceae bacterium]